MTGLPELLIEHGLFPYLIRISTASDVLAICTSLDVFWAVNSM
jgi:hypothetical protein